MSWFDNIAAQIPGVKLVSGNNTTTAEHPRDVLIKSIKDNIRLLDDPDYKVKVRKEMRAPTALFKQSSAPDYYDVALSYCHTKVELQAGMHAVQVPKVHVKALLEQMIVAVSNHAFDDKLEVIKAKRSASLKTDSKTA